VSSFVSVVDDDHGIRWINIDERLRDLSGLNVKVW
jgi:hypothetical protein